MAEGYDAGEAFLRIVPSFDGVLEAITKQAAKWGPAAGKVFSDSFNEEVKKNTSNAPLGPSTQQTTRQGQATGRTFADSFKARVEAALKSLPDIHIGAATDEAEQKLRDLSFELDRLSQKTIGVDIDEGEALAELDRLKVKLDELGAESPNVSVKIDTARASAELAKIQAQIAAVKAESDVAGGGGDSGAADLAATGEAADGATGSIFGLASALVALSPLAAGIGAVLVAGLAAVAATALAAAAGIGVLALGLAGVSKTVGLLNQKQQLQAAGTKKAGATAISSAAQQVAAAEAIKNAEQALADARTRAAIAQKQAAEQVAAAQYQLTQADQSEANAQVALNDAREQAARDLESAADRQKDAILAVQQAQLDLNAANAKYQNDLLNPAVPAATLAQEKLDVAKAQQALTEAQQEATNATADNTKAQKEGVNGAPAVVSAQQQLADAQHQQLVATQAVTDALAAQKQQAKDSAEAIQKAQQAIGDAYRNAAVQQAQAGATTQTQLEKVNAELAKVNPATLAFAEFIHTQLAPAFDRLKNAAAGGLLPGLQAGLAALKPLFGPLTTFVGSLAKTLGDMFAAAGKAFTSPFWTQFFAFISRTAGPMLETFGQIMGNIAQGFAGLLEAFQPVTDAIGRGLLSISHSFATFGASATKSKSFQDFLAYIRKVGPDVLKALGGIFVVAGHLLGALAPLGTVMFKLIGYVTGFLKSLTPTQLLLLVGALAGLVAALGGPVTAVIVGVTAIAGVLAAHWDQLKTTLQPFIQFIKTVALDAFAGIRLAIGYVTAEIDKHKAQLTELFHAFQDFVGFIARDVAPIVGTVLKYAFEVLGRAIGAAIDVIALQVKAFNGLVTAAKAVGSWFAGPFVNFFKDAWRDISGVWDHIASFFATLWDGVKSDAATFVSDMGKIWGGLEDVFKKPIKFLIQYVLNDGLIKAWDWVADNVPGLSGAHIQPIHSKWLGLATGGVLPGYAPGVDSIHAMLSPGEGVLRPEVVRALGPDTIHGWNRLARNGGFGFATGGVLDGQGRAHFSSGGILGAFNPEHWVSYLAEHFKGPLNAFHSFDQGAVGKILVGLPLGITKAMIAAVKALALSPLTALKNFPGDISTGLGYLSGQTGTLTPNGLSKSPDAVRAWTKNLIASFFGWTGAQWADLNALWTRESGWNYRATNPSSGAYGIPQSLPADKMAVAGKDWATNPYTQVAWGLNYITQRYGNPGYALAHENKFSWYDQGGALPPGRSLVYNGTGQAELVAPQSTFEQLMSRARDEGDTGPSVFNLFDADGALIGRMRGEAVGVVRDSVIDARLRGGK